TPTRRHTPSDTADGFLPSGGAEGSGCRVVSHIGIIGRFHQNLAATGLPSGNPRVREARSFASPSRLHCFMPAPNRLTQMTNDCLACEFPVFGGPEEPNG